MLLESGYRVMLRTMILVYICPCLQNSGIIIQTQYAILFQVHFIQTPRFQYDIFTTYSKYMLWRLLWVNRTWIHILIIIIIWKHIKHLLTYSYVCLCNVFIFMILRDEDDEKCLCINISVFCVSDRSFGSFCIVSFALNYNLFIQEKKNVSFVRFWDDFKLFS